MSEIRYTKITNDDGPTWLFMPGGPGGDSSYFNGLVEILDLPGTVYLIDLPGNGREEKLDFDCWFDLFVQLVKQFDKPIVVGHSFGGMLPLMFPEMENLLSAVALLHTAPCLWQEAAAKKADAHGLPSLEKEMTAMMQNPCNETFKAALDACMPYYFAPKNVEKHREEILALPFNYYAAMWGQIKLTEMNYSAKWIPQKVPTLLIGGEHDCMCPFELFDERFDRKNIDKVFLKDAGHFGWMERPEAYQEAFEKLVERAKG